MANGNPVMREETLFQLARENDGNTMTLRGTTNKAAMLLGILVVTAFWVYVQYQTTHNMGFVGASIVGGALGGLVLCLMTVFMKTASAWLAPMYAIAEGFFIGGISVMANIKYPGIIIPAVGLTFGVTFVMLAIYRLQIIKVTAKLRMAVVAATCAIALLYLVSMVLGIFGHAIPMIHEGGPIGVGFSLIVVGLAAFNLLLDFDYIEAGVAAGAPKYMEWFAAFGLLVTLVWLYVEILRLLSKLQRK